MRKNCNISLRLFFVIIGSQVDLGGINQEVIVLAIMLISVSISTKLIGCGISALFLKNKSRAKIVGVGMISLGEVGLIVAGVGGVWRRTILRHLHVNYTYGCVYYYLPSNLA
ncbi:cation:proton antiporter [Candidatus Nitrosocosmicus arcticus]|nr:cation:proton antiporter [Candidatus Nitrosocosmicus arcticus]